ncbi:MAG TPA: NUDIX domain-containing protein, partial [Candidatus Dormibacteraeota bacterium]|nr:NUDIX domain-containing protein [Candidatus Dormibacteraeota bacterium]
LLLFRRRDDRLEVLLAHPGGPLFARRDAGSWTLPKGLIEPGEAPIDVARREFREETGAEPPADPATYLALGQVRQASGKLVHAWAAPGDLDPAQARSNTFQMEYPRGSGRYETFPEVDRVAWFEADEARRRLNPAQVVLVDRLLAALDHQGSPEP